MKRFAPIVVALSIILVRTNAHAGSCHEVSDVVGEQHCSRYGNLWSIERSVPIAFRFGFRYAEFGTAGSQFEEGYKRSQRPDGYKGYAFDGESLGVSRLFSYGMDGGFTVFVIGQLYAGLEAGLGFASLRDTKVSAGDFTLTPDGGIDVITWHAGAPIGYRIPIGRVSIRGEMFLGFTSIEIQQKVSAPTVKGAPDSASAMAQRWLVEPRAAADIWFSQHISFGVYGGVNLIDTKGRVLGLSLTWHHRAFDGDMSFW